MTEMGRDDMSVEEALRRILPNIATVYIQNDSIARLTAAFIRNTSASQDPYRKKNDIPEK